MAAGSEIIRNSNVKVFEAAERVEGSAKGAGEYSAPTATYKYYGTFAELSAIKPKYGDRWDANTYSVKNSAANLPTVVSAQVVRQEGCGMAELTVNCGEIVVQGASTEITTDASETTVEVTCAEVSQPLAFAKKFVENADPEAWALFLASPAKVQAQCRYLVDPDNPNSEQEQLDSETHAFAVLYNKGITTFVAYQPIVTRTTRSTSAATPSGIGKKSSPPKYADLAKSWLKTGDSVSMQYSKGADGSRQTVYARTEQWTGAEDWPAILYGGTN